MTYLAAVGGGATALVRYGSHGPQPKPWHNEKDDASLDEMRTMRPLAGGFAWGELIVCAKTGQHGGYHDQNMQRCKADEGEELARGEGGA